MSLPALPRGAIGHPAAETVINRLIREFNRPDRKAPIIGTDTGTGAAYAIAPVPGIVAYEVGQEFAFVAAHTNTVANPTLAVNGLAAGTLGTGAGTIAAGAMVRVVVAAVASGVPTFRLLSPRPVFTAALGADVALSNTGTRFTGPSVAQGNDGLWLVTGQLVVQDTAAANGARFYGFLSDGTTTIASAAVSTYLANAVAILSMSGIIAQPAGNLRLAAQDATAVTGRILGNVSGGGKDLTITAVRLD